MHMKKFLSLIVIVIFTLVGCNTNASKTLSNNELFEKKKECASLKKELETYIKTEMSWEEDSTGSSRSAYLGKIFYSPKRNSCMYTVETASDVNDDRSHGYWLFDAFTNELMVQEIGWLNDESYMNANVTFDTRVSEYE